MDCRKIYETYGKLFGDTRDATKHTLSPTKLSRCGFELGIDNDREDADKLPINVEGIDSSGGPNEDRKLFHEHIWETKW